MSPHRAKVDHLDESWVNRGLFDPPPFSESLPDHLLRVELNFYRRSGGSPNNIGGFKGQPADVPVLVTHGHAELHEGQGLLADNLSIGAVKRHYELFIPVPRTDEGVIDLDHVPKKGDRVWWYDALGRRLDQPVMEVAAPEGTADHLEISTDEFE